MEERLPKDLSITPVNKNTWVISDGMIRCFLFAGKKKALLLDTGFGAARIDEKVRELTSLPVFVVNTHVHPDHIGGNKYFSEIYAHPKGIEEVNDRTMLPASEGIVFDLGGRKLQVIDLPGHTPDGIALVDYKNGSIYTGDVVEFDKVAARDLPGYIASISRIMGMKDNIRDVYLSHGERCPVAVTDLQDLLDALKKTASGELKAEPLRMEIPTGGVVDTFIFRYKGVNVLYESANKGWPH